MARSHRKHSPDVPPEFRLPSVTEATVAQADAEPLTFSTRIEELRRTNPQLLFWLRREATTSFPHDMEGRRAAVSMTLGALGLVQNQVLLDALQQRFTMDLLESDESDPVTPPTTQRPE